MFLFLFGYRMDGLSITIKTRYKIRNTFILIAHGICVKNVCQQQLIEILKANKTVLASLQDSASFYV